MAGAVREALSEEPGDVLVFLPGAGEIRRTAELLHETVSADVVSLHGNLSGEEQDRAIRPSPPGRRKVVLATSIAETSLTIEGVKVVIDAGLSRVPRFSVAHRNGPPRHGARLPGLGRPAAGTSGSPRPRGVLPALVGAGGRGSASPLPAGNPGDRPRSARARARRGGRREPRRARDGSILRPRPRSPRHAVCSSSSAPSMARVASPPTAGAWRGWRWLRGWPTWSYGAASWETERRPASWPPC